MESLSIPGHCGPIRRPEEVSVESSFHNSYFTSLNELKCHGDSPSDVVISRSLLTVDENLPLYTDVIVQSRSQSWQVITSAESLLRLGSANANNPYVAVALFNSQVWAMLVPTVFATALMAALTTQKAWFRFGNARFTLFLGQLAYIWSK